MTTRVWFENDAIQMDGIGPIPARGLYTVLDGDRVHIFTLPGDRQAQLLYTEYARKDGSGFASAAEAKAYLDGELGRYPSFSGPRGANLTAPAAQNMAGHRAVIMTAAGINYPSLTNPEHGDAIVGITTGATDAGGMAEYQSDRTMSDPSWSLTPGPIFCGDAGYIVQSPPTGTWLRQIGEAVSPNTIAIHLFPTYYLQGA